MLKHLYIGLYYSISNYLFDISFKTSWFTCAFLGLKFWKAPNRKIFAVPEEDHLLTWGSGSSSHNLHIHGRKRLRSEDLPPKMYIDDALVPLTEKVDLLKNNIEDIKDQLKEVFKVTKHSMVPLSMKRSFEMTFQCKICRSLMTPPIIFSKCCRSLLGCVSCVDEWYNGPDGLMKNCPNCNTERGYAETIRIAGIDELIGTVRPIFDDPDDAQNSIYSLDWTWTKYLFILNSRIYHSVHLLLSSFITQFINHSVH